jgi:hypothetical protein
MRRTSALLAVLMAAATLALSAPAAQAVDHRACTTRGEFRSIHAPMTLAQVRNKLDGPGRLVKRVDNGYYAGGWVRAGYWDKQWVDDGYYDDEGNLHDTSHWENVWVDTTYWADDINWVSSIDQVRSFSKCRSFDRHRARRFAIDLDNYTSRRSGLRVFVKSRYDVWGLVAQVNEMRTTEAGKPLPHAGARPPKPAPKPLTPAPHPAATQRG